MSNAAVTAETNPFRAEARGWLEANFPPSLKGHAPIGEAPVAWEGDAGLWKSRMAAKGWGVPTWPAT